MQAVINFFASFDGAPLRIAIIAALLVAVGVLIFAVYRMAFANRLRLPGGARTRQPRLGVVDAFLIDGQRRLVLIRRDNVEHLVMIGGPNDVVIESQIVRAAPAIPREKDAVAPRMEVVSDASPASAEAPPTKARPTVVAALESARENQPPKMPVAAMSEKPTIVSPEPPTDKSEPPRAKWPEPARKAADVIKTPEVAKPTEAPAAKPVIPAFSRPAVAPIEPSRVVAAVKTKFELPPPIAAKLAKFVTPAARPADAAGPVAAPAAAASQTLKSVETEPTKVGVPALKAPVKTEDPFAELDALEREMARLLGRDAG